MKLTAIFFLTFFFFFHSVESSSGHGSEPALTEALAEAPEGANVSAGGFLRQIDKCANSTAHIGCVDGLLVPAWKPHAESAFDVAARAIIYFLSLAYCINSK